MKLIVDTDGGIDDAIALLMVLAHPDTNLEAVTIVLGNVSLAQATQNIKTILDVANAPSLPIYRGCAQPLLRYQSLDAKDVHGDDGLGGAARTESRRTIEAEHASLALIRRTKQQPGQLTLLTLGPLTNLAVAVRLDPHFLARFARIVMMAGAVDARGNTSAAAEFNIAVDPEAAKIVFDACGRDNIKPQLISWEATLVHPLSPEMWAKIIRGISPVARLVQQMTVYLDERRAAYKESNFFWPDPLAAAVTCEPDIVVAQETRFMDIETGQNLTRGQTLVDYRRLPQNPPNIRIVRQVDNCRFQKLLRMAVCQKEG